MVKRVVVFLCLVFLAGCGGGGGDSVSIPVGDPSLPFHVFSSTPTGGQTGVAANTIVPVTLRFNRVVDTASVVAGITVTGPTGNVPGTVAASATTATFTPDAPFAPLTEYTLTVAAGVLAADNSALLAPHVLRFTTIANTFNFVLNQYEPKHARKVGEGLHCYIYLEAGRTVSQATVDALISRFDTDIYGNVTAAFGNEPNPGVDGSPKIYILLMDIVDGYVPGGGYIGGYFDAMNEFPSQAGNPSNQKEMFYMDISPGNPSGSPFYRTLAHEFQHMIHWNRKESDDAWLNEAMSEAAPFYAGFGPNYSRVDYFQQTGVAGPFRSDSLTQWNDQLEDYSVVYMWAQYMADRFPATVFRDILSEPSTGINSVSSYLAANFPGTTFASVFRDWSIAVLSGTTITWPGHPEWSYTTIDTWPGPPDTHGGFNLDGFFTAQYTNVTAPAALPAWSIGLYQYTSPDPNQAFTWNSSGLPAPQASFYDSGSGNLAFDLASGVANTYNVAAYLILQNPSGSSSSSSTTLNPSISEESLAVLSPAEKVRAFSKNISLETSLESSGEPVPVCIHEFLDRRARDARGRGMELRNAR